MRILPTVRGIALSASLIGAPTLPAAPAHAASEAVVYTFQPGNRAYPRGPLIQVGSKLYGTTKNTVFSLTLDGHFKLLHVFGSGTDGSTPESGLVKVGPLLYGTTFYGGTGTACPGVGCGTVYTITPQGAYAVLYNFPGGNNGYEPFASPTDVGGTLYGTTGYGGTAGIGTVYSLTASGVEALLHSFTSTNGDPSSGLTDLDGELYGVTQFGHPALDGTVYRISKAGVYKAIYTFQGGADGSFPTADLINVAGTLYGTTSDGGGGPCNPNTFYGGCGTVFSITPQGVETVLYAFQGGADGASPQDALILVGNTLYGTTSAGGGSGCGGTGCGTVFSISPTGAYQMIYAFQGGSDGADPSAALLNVNGVLYGTTYNGGGTVCYHNAGCGTVFRITP